MHNNNFRQDNMCGSSGLHHRCLSLSEMPRVLGTLSVAMPGAVVGVLPAYCGFLKAPFHRSRLSRTSIFQSFPFAEQNVAIMKYINEAQCFQLLGRNNKLLLSPSAVLSSIITSNSLSLGSRYLHKCFCLKVRG